MQTEKSPGDELPGQEQRVLQDQNTTADIEVTSFPSWQETNSPSRVSVADVVAKIRQEPALERRISRLRALVRAGKLEIFNAEKDRLPGVVWQGTFSRRDGASCLEYSGLAVIDFDHLGNKLSAVRSLLEADEHTVAAFLSPSADGLKWVVRVAVDGRPDAESWKLTWRGVADYASRLTGIPVNSVGIDPTGSDLPRFCFYSHDRDCFFNESAKPLTVATVPAVTAQAIAQKPATATPRPYLEAALESACELIRATGAKGGHHGTLLKQSHSIGGLPGIDLERVREELVQAAVDAGSSRADAEKCVDDGLKAGSAKPRTIPESNDAAWPEPLPLIARVDPVPYPVDSLPTCIRAAVEEVAAFSKAPFPIVASSALAAVSLAIQAHFDIERAERLTGPTGLYFLTIAESGERKTTVDGFFRGAIEAYQAKEAEKAKPIIARYRADLDSWESRRAGIKEKIRQCSKEGKATAPFEEQLRSIELQRPVEPKYPRLLRGDETPENLGRDLAKQWPSAGIIVSEAGLVLGSHGMNGESVMRNLGLLNILWDGGTLAVGRRTAESFTIRGARLTMSLQVQEPTLRAFFDRSAGLARGTGFLARFLVAWPESTVGTRFFEDPPKQWPALERFHARITDLLERPVSFDGDGLDPVMNKLSDDAKAAWVGFHDCIERELATGGELQDVRDTASKAADNVARLANLFHVFENGGGAVGADSLTRAGRIVAWHLNESRRFFGELAMPEEQALAGRLDAWLADHCRRKHTDRASTRDIQHKGPYSLRQKDSLKTAMDELAELGRVRVVRDGKKKLIVRNPALADQGAKQC